MSKNPVTDNLKKFLESEQAKYGRDFGNNNSNTSERIRGSSRYSGPEKDNKYGTIGDKRNK